MREYDVNQPLIAIHIPKTAGTSVKQIFQGWFGDNLLFHYHDIGNDILPAKHDLAGKHSKQKPIMIYGHFNRLRSFGIEDYYPEIQQFITILRDPIEYAASSYFYMRKNSSNWKDQSRIPKGDLRDYLFQEARIGSMLNHFPRTVTMDNYQEMIETQFIEIGVTDYLEASMNRIAEKLNRPYLPGSLPRLNATEWDQAIPEILRAEYREYLPLDYAVYDYVLAKYV